MFPYCCLLITCFFFILCSVFKVHRVSFIILWLLSLKRLNEVSTVIEASFNPLNLFRKMVGQSGLEPPTSRLSVVCSSQLSYWPVSWWSVFCFSMLTSHQENMVEISGIEPLTSCLQGRRSPSWAKPPYPSLFWSGGPKWTRTIDLTIISRVL